MAGELLFHPFDRAAYDTLAPVLDELDAARALSEPARRAVAALVALPPARDLAFERAREAAARLAATPGVELRVHLGPGELDDLIDALVRLACLPAGGEFSLVESVGPGWVVLDGAQRHLVSRTWFDALFMFPEARFVVDLPHPGRGESRWQVLTAEGATLLVGGLDTVLATEALAAHHRAELGALRAFAISAVSGSRELAYQSLL